MGDKIIYSGSLPDLQKVAASALEKEKKFFFSSFGTVNQQLTRALLYPFSFFTTSLCRVQFVKSTELFYSPFCIHSIFNPFLS